MEDFLHGLTREGRGAAGDGVGPRRAAATAAAARVEERGWGLVAAGDVAVPAARPVLVRTERLDRRAAVLGGVVAAAVLGQAEAGLAAVLVAEPVNAAGRAVVEGAGAAAGGEPGFAAAGVVQRAGPAAFGVSLGSPLYSRPAAFADACVMVPLLLYLGAFCMPSLNPSEAEPLATTLPDGVFFTGDRVPPIFSAFGMSAAVGSPMIPSSLPLTFFWFRSSLVVSVFEFPPTDVSVAGRTVGLGFLGLAGFGGLGGLSYN